VAAATNRQDPRSGRPRWPPWAAWSRSWRPCRWPTPGPRAGPGDSSQPAWGHQPGRAPQGHRPSVRLVELARWPSKANMPAGCWTCPARRPNALGTASSAPSTWCRGCSGTAAAGPAGSGGQRCQPGRRSSGAATHRCSSARVLDHAGRQARALGIAMIGPSCGGGGVTDIQTPWPRGMNNRWGRRLHAWVGLARNDRGAAGPLLAALGVDLDQLREAVTVELAGSGHEPAGPTRLVVACLLACGVIAALIGWGRRPSGRTRTPATVTLAPGPPDRPAGPPPTWGTPGSCRPGSTPTRDAAAGAGPGPSLRGGPGGRQVGGPAHPGALPGRPAGGLFDRNATWARRPPRPVSSGATVIGNSDRLAAAAAPLLR
jgi:Clp amino terminal domain, pathogenicity island component